LAIASSLVELMGGEMGVESKVGKGSTFWFSITLPAHGEAEDEQAPAIPIDVTGSRILVVDDNAVNRAILLEQMQAWQFDAAACESGQEAMELLSAAIAQDVKIDCVLLDYHMPEMNGADVAREMRADSRFANVPVIMLTSVDHMEDGRAFSSLGIQGQLTKPVRSSYLLETIISVLTEEHARSARDGLSSGVDIARKMGEENMISKSDTPANPGHSEGRSLESDQGNDSSDQNAEIQNQKYGNDPASASDSTSKPFSASNVIVKREQIDILVCEDNEVNQIVFSQILEATDYKFEIANDGEEGLEIYRKKKPRLVLMDVSMPKMNGLEATGEIRKLESDTDHHTPIIGVTAHAIKGDLEKCLDAGMDDYLSKPVSPDRLVEKVETWIQQGSSKRAIA
ncbi:MAG: response regulator, partial [Rhizobiaceae bacterium]